MKDRMYKRLKNTRKNLPRNTITQKDITYNILKTDVYTGVTLDNRKTALGMN